MTKNKLYYSSESFYQKEVNGLDCVIVSVVVVIGILFLLLALCMVIFG